MMNDIVENTASPLAILENKHQRPGCVGIFFHLFDWSRRFVKKKMFSKKLLTPVSFKLASTKLARNEKLPKLRLITDGNTGGFLEIEHETRISGLVDRGLPAYETLNDALDDTSQSPCLELLDSADEILDDASQSPKAIMICRKEYTDNPADKEVDMEVEYEKEQDDGEEEEKTNEDDKVSKDKSSKEAVVDIIRNVSESLSGFDLNQDEYDYAENVLLDAELLFRNAFPSSYLVGRRSSLIQHLLLDELEKLTDILWMKFGSTLGIDNSEKVDELRRFAFDAIIEYLNSRLGGHTTDAKLPIPMSTDALIFEVVEAVGRWKGLSSFSLAELVDWEVNRSVGVWAEWTQYQT